MVKLKAKVVTPHEMVQNILSWEHVAYSRATAINIAKDLVRVRPSHYYREVLGILKAQGVSRRERRQSKAA